ncbi:MAG: hypothetical protein ACM3SP_27330 [Chloroflexota bacterium]
MAGWLIGVIAVCAASYEEMRSAAVKSCQAIDPAAYQSGLLFNPEGYRSYYVRSECFQRIAVEFRDLTLCAQVKQRYSLFSSSWGYSKAQCSKLVRKGIAADEKILLDMKQRYRQGAMQLHDFRIERNGNGHDFDIIPAFTGNYGHGYILRFELFRNAADKQALPIHASDYYVDGKSNLRIFVRQEDIRKRFSDLILGRTYTVRATVILDIGNGEQAGKWSDTFIERVFPERQRSQFLDRDVQF